ncbi:protein-disulfide isomerase [Aurantiacibacter xanthus]|uniref:Protein-disulfide isomerase n=1 Tax=Aurantiacibacter xanthus TaxID=1784712 RepID=A0A3A1P3L3_9SPHN|nr:thioredoxin domain-containing protein [Aurantiacibacter xanthus]RIV86075.1 protein-disulfide isomerase [Aurantiacibacter xanthus]
MTKPSLFFRAALALPLALLIASCGDEATDATSLEGEPVAAVEAPDGSSWNQTVARTDKGGWLVGNPEAPVKLVEYGSLTCPACAAFSVDGSAQLHEKYIESGRVSYEFRSVLIHGIADLLLTRMISCAPKEAAVPLADQVWANLEGVLSGFQNNQAALEQAMNLPDDQRYVAMAQASGVTDFFAARGISTEQTQACMADSAAIEALAESTQAAATEDKVNSTPTFFLNGQELQDRNWVSIEPALQRAGARDK